MDEGALHGSRAGGSQQHQRVLRHAVLWRKSSGGTDSAADSRLVHRMLSVVSTCQQQNLGVLGLLTA
jgi:transposase